MNTSHIDLESAPAGTVISAQFFLWRHKGILSERRVAGERTVISNSMRAGGVVEELLRTFSGGNPIRIDGYPGGRHPSAVVAAARALIGRPYKALESNCEHLVAEVHGLPPSSPQVTLTAAAVAVGVLVAVS